jgi:hypothetical protein
MGSGTQNFVKAVDSCKGHWMQVRRAEGRSAPRIGPRERSKTPTAGGITFGRVIRALIRGKPVLQAPLIGR